MEIFFRWFYGDFFLVSCQAIFVSIVSLQRRVDNPMVGVIASYVEYFYVWFDGGRYFFFMECDIFLL